MLCIIFLEDGVRERNNKKFCNYLKGVCVVRGGSKIFDKLRM